MNRFFELFGGPLAVLLSIIATIIISRKWKKYRSENTRPVMVALLYWGPVFLMATMLLHNVQNAYRALASYRETGTFNFYFYSLQLFGFVVAYQSYLLLLSCRQLVSTKKRKNQTVYKNLALIVFTTLPTFAFTPIGIIPTGVLLFTLLISFGVYKKRKTRRTKLSVVGGNMVLSNA